MGDDEPRNVAAPTQPTPVPDPFAVLTVTEAAARRTLRPASLWFFAAGVLVLLLDGFSDAKTVFLAVVLIVIGAGVAIAGYVRPARDGVLLVLSPEGLQLPAPGTTDLMRVPWADVVAVGRVSFVYPAQSAGYGFLWREPYVALSGASAAALVQAWPDARHHMPHHVLAGFAFDGTRLVLEAGFHGFSRGELADALEARWRAFGHAAAPRPPARTLLDHVADPVAHLLWGRQQA